MDRSNDSILDGGVVGQLVGRSDELVVVCVGGRMIISTMVG